MDTRYLDDLKPGDRFVSGGLTLTEAEIIDFAFRYDPQPFHLDANAAAGYPLEWRSYPMEHSLCLPEVRDIEDWLAKVLVA